MRLARSSKLLATTDTLLRAIAAAAPIGGSDRPSKGINIPVASGMASVEELFGTVPQRFPGAVWYFGSVHE